MMRLSASHFLISAGNVCHALVAENNSLPLSSSFVQPQDEEVAEFTSLEQQRTSIVNDFYGDWKATAQLVGLEDVSVEQAFNAMIAQMPKVDAADLQAVHESVHAAEMKDVNEALTSLIMDSMQATPADEGAEAPEVPEFHSGDNVEIFGLKGAAEHNGKVGKLLEFDAKKERWQVKISDQKIPLGLKPVNLKLKSKSPSKAKPFKQGFLPERKKKPENPVHKELWSHFYASSPEDQKKARGILLYCNRRGLVSVIAERIVLHFLQNTVRPENYIRIHGLQSKPELNGTIGKATLFNTAKGRWEVRYPEAGSGQTQKIMVSSSNLHVHHPWKEFAARSKFVTREQVSEIFGDRLCALASDGPQPEALDVADLQVDQHLTGADVNRMTVQGRPMFDPMERLLKNKNTFLVIYDTSNPDIHDNAAALIVSPDHPDEFNGFSQCSMYVANNATNGSFPGPHWLPQCPRTPGKPHDSFAPQMAYSMRPFDDIAFRWLPAFTLSVDERTPHIKAAFHHSKAGPTSV